MYVGM
ncbi:hypothetical protein BsWGS_04005 [Bradybaena similaris]